MTDADDPGEGPGALGPRELFVLVAEECFRDGRIDPGENQVLNRLTSRLGLEKADVVEMAKAARERFQAGELGDARPLDPAPLVARVEEAIRADGVVEEAELELLRDVRALLGVPDAPPPEKKKTDAESGSAEDRGLRAKRVRVTRREFMRDAPDLLPEGASRPLWLELSARAPGRPRFEGPDVLYLIGGVMILYGVFWVVEELYDYLGVMIPSLLGGALAAYLARKADRDRSRGIAHEVAGKWAVAAAFLAGASLGGVTYATGLQKWLCGNEFGNLSYVTLLAAAPAGVAAGLLLRGLCEPRLPGIVLGLGTAIGAFWIQYLFSPGRHAAWALATLWGLVNLRLGYSLDRRTPEDMARAPYTLGLFLVWVVGLWMMPFRGELAWLAFAGANLLLMSVAAALERGMFLTCGALGVYSWLGHLSFHVFRGALLFPFALTFVGLTIMGTGIWYQRNQEEVRTRLRDLLPAALRPELPSERPAATAPEPAEADPEQEREFPPEAVAAASRLDLSEADLRDAGAARDLPPETLARLWSHLETGDPVRARLTLPHILYFLGALTVIGSMTFFMGLCWSTMGDLAVLVLAVLYGVLFAAAGWRLWQDDATKLPGGLLVTMAVCMAPLATWAFESLTGIWPQGDPGAYQGFYTWVKGSWIVMELVTIAAGLVALRFVRFPFLTAPIAFSCWYLSMDLTPLLIGQDTFTWKARCWVSMLVGAGMILASWMVDRRTDEDYSWWGYLFGVLAFWGGLSSAGSGSAYGKLIYAAVNAGMILVGGALERQVFVGFGLVGFHGVVAYELFRIFSDVPGFPLLVAAAGGGVVWLGRRLRRNPERMDAWLEHLRRVGTPAA